MVHKPKVVLLGDSTVGKTSFASRAKHDSFVLDVSATIGCEFFSCDHTNGTDEFRFLIWDTAGQEVFRTFTPQFCRNTAIALIFYDLSDLSTCTSLQEWITISDPGSDVIIVPTKLDLFTGEGIPPLPVIDGQGRTVHIAKPTSSKTNTGIDDLLTQMAHVVLQRGKSKTSANSVSITTIRKRPGKCC